jgi:hypothetical protein
VADARREERERVATDMAALAAEAAQAVARWKHEAALRRAVHNRLVDYLGAIRVFARVRPILPHEAGRGGMDARDVTSCACEGSG